MQSWWFVRSDITMFKFIRQPLCLLGHLAKRALSPLRIGYRLFRDEPNNPLNQDAFDENMLDVVVCALLKGTLRFNKESNELICDEIGAAYLIVNSNMILQDARKLDGNS